MELADAPTAPAVSPPPTPPAREEKDLPLLDAVARLLARPAVRRQTWGIVWLAGGLLVVFVALRILVWWRRLPPKPIPLGNPVATAPLNPQLMPVVQPLEKRKAVRPAATHTTTRIPFATPAPVSESNIPFACPNCHHVMQAADSAAGQAVRCPFCRRKLRVPVTTQDVVPPKLNRSGR